MNEYLMMSAAAVLAGTASGAANAATHSFTFASAYGNPYCDGGTVYETGTNSTLWTWAHTNNNCAGGVSYGFGVRGKSPACIYPPTGIEFICAVMSDPYFCQNDGLCSWSISYALPKKIKTGQPYLLFIKFSGTSSFPGGYGVLVNAMPNHKAKNSTISRMKELIALHRNSRSHYAAPLTGQQQMGEAQ